MYQVEFNMQLTARGSKSFIDGMCRAREENVVKALLQKFLFFKSSLTFGSSWPHQTRQEEDEGRI